MIERRNEGSWQPRPEDLAAYGDGELDGPSLRRLAEWLVEHPEAAAEVESFERLRRLVRAAPPPEPAEARWADVFGRIEAALPAAPSLPARQGLLERVRPFRAAAAALLALALAAAGVAVVVVALAPFGKVSPPGGPPASADADLPWPVVLAADVEIISMDGADLKALVVGEPPLRGDVNLAAAGDVEEIHIAEDWEDRVRVVGMDGGGGAVPMVVAAAPGKQE